MQVDARQQLEQATAIVAYVDEEGGRSQVADLAAEVAERSGARLILYALQAYTPLADPVPTAWSADRDPGLLDNPLRAGQLERLGHVGLAHSVAAARARGIDAAAWLPREGGVDGMVDYARQQGADVVLLPAEMDEPNLLQRLVGETAGEAAAQDRPELPVLLVDAQGRVSRAGSEERTGSGG